MNGTMLPSERNYIMHAEGLFVETEATPAHSALPWDISKIGNNYDQYSIYSGDELIVNSCEGKANAKFIVTACNSHDALLEACRGILRHSGIDETWLAPIRAAIAQAEGK